MPHKRTLHTLLLAGLFVLVSGLMSPPSPWINTGVGSDAFWLTKAFHSQQHDMILAGDSRVLKGLSPSAMANVWPSMSIFNFGFDHNAFTEAYLDEMERILDRSGAHPVMVLGISPQSLTLEAAQQNGFSSLRSLGRFDRFQRRYMSSLLVFFAPYNLYVWADALRGIPGFKYYQHHHEDGWVASRKEPEDPAYQIRRYQGRFDNNQVNDDMVRRLMNRVRQWTLEGIHVFALRLPTSPAMWSLENRESGFDSRLFIHSLEEAGGIWLEIDPFAYHSYDGSHLREDAAVRLSNDIALEMRKLLDNPTVAEEIHPHRRIKGNLQ